MVCVCGQIDIVLFIGHQMKFFRFGAPLWETENFYPIIIINTAYIHKKSSPEIQLPTFSRNPYPKFSNS